MEIKMLILPIRISLSFHPSNFYRTDLIFFIAIISIGIYIHMQIYVQIQLSR